MEHYDLKKELADYFLRNGRFEGGRDYVGMSSSQYPSLFLKFFHELDREHKMNMVSILTHIAMAAPDQFSQNLGEIISLLGRLAIDKQLEYLKPHQQLLEDHFLSKSNLKTWADSGDEAQNNSKKYLLSWRFALALFCILKRIGSTKVDEGYLFLVDNSKSEHFVEALKTNWQTIVVRKM